MDLPSLVRLQLCLATVLADQPWSPIVGGSPLFPPLVSSPNLLVHSPPLSGLSEPPRLPLLSFHDKRHYHRRVTPRRRRPYKYRPKYRRRRRYFREPQSRARLRHVRSHIPPAQEELQGRARVARQEEGRGFVRNFRNLFGAPEHCLEKGRQYSCTFAPVCWVTGGVATPGNVTALDLPSDIDNCNKSQQASRSSTDHLISHQQQQLWSGFT